jgi:hypothetical protein
MDSAVVWASIKSIPHSYPRGGSTETHGASTHCVANVNHEPIEHILYVVFSNLERVAKVPFSLTPFPTRLSFSTSLYIMKISYILLLPLAVSAAVVRPRSEQTNAAVSEITQGRITQGR